jgi:hypothetical protein
MIIIDKADIYRETTSQITVNDDDVLQRTLAGVNITLNYSKGEKSLF